MDDPEEWWHVLEAANKYMNTRLVEQIERRLRDIARKEGGKGVILKHLKMAYRIGFDSSVKTVFLNSVIKNTSKLIQTDQWNQLEESSIMKIYDQDFLAATEGELYMGAKTWCLRNTSNEAEALKIFLEKFAPRITPEYMSQRDFLTYVANDAFLAQVDVFRDWTIKILVKNASENTIRGSYRPMRVSPKTCKALELLNCPLFRFSTSTSTQSRRATRPHSSKKKLPLSTSLRR